MLLQGKVVIITGATRGIGKEIALYFAKQGAELALIGRRDYEQVEDFIKKLEDCQTKVKYYKHDVSLFKESQDIVDKIVEDFGRIDVLINNAGITKDTLLLRMSEEDWDKVITVNLKSVFNMSKAVLRYMLKERQGSIINMSSVVGLSGNVGQSNYSASKAGIIGFTKSVAKELGSRNIRCNVIAPGFIETDMTKELPEEYKNQWLEKIPLKRPGKPEDVAKVALFLASDLSEYITGQVINVCGGLEI